MSAFAEIPEQPEAKRLLDAALADGDAHAFLFHGPRGVGKRAAARAFAGALLRDPRRVAAGTHPDLRVIEALGEMIRIDEIRALHHDLHMRPFEADRRVYLLLDAHLMNAEAFGALLKDLEEPPAYATLVLVADELGSLPDTIRSRCQLVPFRRLSRAAVEGWLRERAPDLPADEAALLARVAGGRLDRAARLLDEDARARRTELLRVARSVYLDDELDPVGAATVVLESSRAHGEAARAREQELVDGLDLPAREAEQRVKRAEFGAEKEELLASLEDLAAWYRDLVVMAEGAEASIVHADHLEELRADADGRGRGAEEAAAAVRQAWREAEEFNLNAALMLEALFVRARRAFA
ncbi:MAG TPA: DNA polymerase III subunit [Gaiella sp.]|nr:DNA polymerase III subunit [Gaiella sp.]